MKQLSAYSRFNVWKSPYIFLAIGLLLLCQIKRKTVILAGKRVSSATDGELRTLHGAWIPAIHAGMTSFDNVKPES
jgi:hypothetical protein